MALTVVGIKKAANGRLGDGGGLELHKKGDSGKWIYRYSFAGKRREMGLGTWPTVSLSDARKERDRWALVLSQGKDPVAERKAQKAASIAEQSRRDPTLQELAEEIFDVYKSELRGGGTSGRWMSPLNLHVFPKIGRRPVSSINQEDIRAALAPIWKEKHPTAEKAIQRLRIIFTKGRFKGYDVDPFTIAAARESLGRVIHRAAPTPSIDWQNIPTLYRWLEGRGASAVCMQFLILTLVRVSGCRMARFEEFNEDLWIVPSERVKGREGRARDFRVPLPTEARRIVERQRELGGEWVFPGYRGRPLSDSSMSKLLRDNGIQCKPHGFRATFRTWVQDTEATTFDVAETILGHTIGGKTERAYARSDLLERRRSVMEEWAGHVTREIDVAGRD